MTWSQLEFLRGKAGSVAIKSGEGGDATLDGLDQAMEEDRKRKEGSQREQSRNGGEGDRKN